MARGTFVDVEAARRLKAQGMSTAEIWLSERQCGNRSQELKWPLRDRPPMANEHFRQLQILVPRRVLTRQFRGVEYLLCPSHQSPKSLRSRLIRQDKSLFKITHLPKNSNG